MSVANQGLKTVSLALWYIPGAPEDAEALTEVLMSSGAATVRRSQTFIEWMASEADVLLLRGSGETALRAHSGDRLFREHDFDFESLKGRRVIGIGDEGGTVFDALGLEIGRGGSCWFDLSEPSITLGAGPCVPEGLAGSDLIAFRSSSMPGGAAASGCKGVFFPKTGKLAGQVEAIARWADHPNYAAISRQGSNIASGVTADVRTWCEEFKAVFRDVAIALGSEPVEPFKLGEWEVAQPGAYSFPLALSGDTESPFHRAFHFKFPEPVLFSADLEMSRGGQVMMFFRGHGTHRAGDRVDAARGETLHILMPVTGASVRSNGERYWELDITNFDGEVPADCELRIRYDTDAVVRLPDGLDVPLCDPPEDTRTIERLLLLLSAEDGEVVRRATAALVIIGNPAVPALEAAKRRGEKAQWLQIARIIRLITKDA